MSMPAILAVKHIMQSSSESEQIEILSCGVHAIGKKHGEESVFGDDDHGCSGKTRMTECRIRNEISHEVLRRTGQMEAKTTTGVCAGGMALYGFFDSRCG